MGLFHVSLFYRSGPILAASCRELFRGDVGEASTGGANPHAGIIEPKLGSMLYTVILEQEADGGYVATVPALPGCVSQGDTREEVMRNIREAADLYIEDCIAAGDPVPSEAGREYVELKTGTH